MLIWGMLARKRVLHGKTKSMEKAKFCIGCNSDDGTDFRI